MTKATLIPLGVGDAFSARHYTSSLLFGLGGDWLLIDCPHPIRKMLREGSIGAGLPAALDIGDIHAAAISHLHADHCCGLEDFGYFSYFALGRKAKLLMHPTSSARMWSGLLAAGMEHVQASPEEPPVQRSLADYFELVDLDVARPVQSGPFSVECRRTIHGVPTFAMRVTVGGRVLGFSADTAYDPSLIEWLGASDLIVHEATTLEHTGLHTPYAKLAALPAALRIKIRLTHLPDGFEPESSVIEPLKQGRTYEV